MYLVYPSAPAADEYVCFGRRLGSSPLYSHVVGDLDAAFLISESHAEQGSSEFLNAQQSISQAVFVKKNSFIWVFSKVKLDALAGNIIKVHVNQTKNQQSCRKVVV